MAGPFHGYLIEFPLVRVDCFTTPRVQPLLPSADPAVPFRAPPARLYLLTHIHSDHLHGLGGDFTGKIVCSEATKRMIPRIEDEKSRTNLDRGKTEVRRAKYAGLAPRPHPFNGTMIDPIEARPYGVPKEYDLGFYNGKEVKVTITLFEANHCPGSTMFLITSPDGAVLHTGDVRADDNFLRRLKGERLLQPFLASPDPAHGPHRHRRLDTIYIDTSALCEVDVPQKEPVLDSLMTLIDRYPPETAFFFNIWTWGWEDLLKAVAKKFGIPVHVDRYKRRIYEAAADAELLQATTVDPLVTRFHACERWLPCEHSKPREGRPAVRVEMAELELVPWDLRSERAFHSASTVQPAQDSPYSLLDTLRVPLARHSTTPELKRLVNLFCPRNLVPNAILQSTLSNLWKLRPDYDWPHGDDPSSGTVASHEEEAGSSLAAVTSLASKPAQADHDFSSVPKTDPKTHLATSASAGTTSTRTETTVKARTETGAVATIAKTHVETRATSSILKTHETSVTASSERNAKTTAAKSAVIEISTAAETQHTRPGTADDAPPSRIRKARTDNDNDTQSTQPRRTRPRVSEDRPPPKFPVNGAHLRKKAAGLPPASSLSFEP